MLKNQMAKLNTVLLPPENFYQCNFARSRSDRSALFGEIAPGFSTLANYLVMVESGKFCHLTSLLPTRICLCGCQKAGVDTDFWP